MKVRVPPIKTQGIKTKLVPLIKQLVSWDHSGKWVEPFMGSGVVGFNILPPVAMFCDSNPHLIDFYSAINDRIITPYIARKFLQKEGSHLEKYGADYYYEVRTRFNQTGDPLDFLFLNRSCFNGLIRFNRKGEYNVPFGHKPQRFSKAYITKIVNQIAYVSDAMQNNDWSFHCQDFETSLQAVEPVDFVYCDPPYLGRHVDYYNGWDEKSEQKLFDILSRCPAKFMLSTWYGNSHRMNEYIDLFWSKFHIVKREHHYHVGAKETNRKPMVEALVMDYTPRPTTIVRSKAEQMQLL